ncbi:hypothetical protein ACYULU_11600 [Breznakiellaceae bacterium SP9]
MTNWRIVFLIALVWVQQAGALDLTLKGGGGTIYFDPARESPADPGGEHFKPFLIAEGSVSVSVPYDEHITLKTDFTRDAILKNTLSAGLALDYGYIAFELAPFAGLLNTKERVFNPGFAGKLKTQWADRLFASASMAASFGHLERAAGDYTQNQWNLAAGFFLSNIIVTFTMQTKRLDELKSDELLISNGLTRYNLRSEVFAKNNPYTVTIDMGMQSIQRTFTRYDIQAGPLPAPASGKKSDELKSLYLGCEIHYTLSRDLRLFAGFESPVYVWGTKPLEKPDKAALLYKAFAGFTLHVNKD